MKVGDVVTVVLEEKQRVGKPNEIVAIDEAQILAIDRLEGEVYVQYYDFGEREMVREHFPYKQIETHESEDEQETKVDMDQETALDVVNIYARESGDRRLNGNEKRLYNEAMEALGN